MKEIAQALRRGKIIPAAVGKGPLLDGRLPLAPGQDAGAGEILRLQCDKQRSIGIFAAAAGIAHTVGHDPAQTGGRGDDIAARAHAECEGTAAAGQMHGQLIICRREPLWVPGRAVLGGVDQRLGVLDAHAHGKGLALHGKAGLGQ